jgi:hypothetical protein
MRALIKVKSGSVEGYVGVSMTWVKGIYARVRGVIRRDEWKLT